MTPSRSDAIVYVIKKEWEKRNRDAKRLLFIGMLLAFAWGLVGGYILGQI